MPHLLFRGVTADQLRVVSAPLVEKLAGICNCGTDNFTMSCLNETSVYGEPTDGPAFVFVEVGWFDRGRQTRNDFALAVTQAIQKLGAAEVEVVFIAYREDSYYVNGTPC